MDVTLVATTRVHAPGFAACKTRLFAESPGNLVPVCVCFENRPLSQSAPPTYTVGVRHADSMAELLASSGHTAVGALVAAGFVVGVGVINFIANNPGAPTEEDFRILRREKRKKKKLKRLLKEKQQQQPDASEDAAAVDDEFEDKLAWSVDQDSGGEPSSAAAPATEQDASSKDHEVDQQLGMRRRRGKNSEFMADGSLREDHTENADDDGGEPNTANSKKQAKKLKQKNKRKKKRSKKNKKKKAYSSEGDSESEEDIDSLFSRAIKGEGTFTKEQNDRVLEEFGDRLTRNDLPAGLLGRRTKMLTALGLDDTKIKLAVEYAKQVRAGGA